MILVADFETTTGNQQVKPSERFTECWLACFVNVEKREDIESYNITTNIKDFFINLITEVETFRESDKNIDVFFHNLKFDGSFIINFLMRNEIPFETCINNMGVWYSVKIKMENYTITFRDSLKILNFSIKTMADIFKMEVSKGETPLLEEKPLEIKPEHKDYIIKDVRILAEGIFQMYFIEKFQKFTSASEALFEFKNIVDYRNYFPTLDKRTDSFIRKAYKGGWSFVNPVYQNKLINKKIVVYDINSMYPSKMLYKAMPYGKPKFYTGTPQFKPNKYFVAKVWLEVDLKKGYLPTFQTKDIKTCLEIGIKSTDYITTTNGFSYPFYLTNFDLELILKHYDVKAISYESYFEFDIRKGFFDEYIQKYKDLKENAKTPAEKQKAKIMLNSLYGKFGSRIESQSKITFIENGVNKFKNGEVEEIESNYVPLSVFITSISRHDIITDAQNNYNHFIYADTDSLHLIENPNINLEEHESTFGLWKKEGIFSRGKYLRAKLYVEELYTPFKPYKKIIKNKKRTQLSLARFNLLCVKGAGMTPEIKIQIRFKNFDFGSKFLGKRATKQVKGGMIIYNTEYTINNHNFFGV